MENPRHIHEVLEIIFGTDKIYTVEELYSTISERFGSDVQFTSCSDNIFPVKEVVPFLLSRQKVRLEADRIIPLAPSCSH